MMNVPFFPRSRACFQADNVNTFLREVVGQGAAASAGADNYNDGIIVLCKWRTHCRALVIREPVDVVESALDKSAEFD